MLSGWENPLLQKQNKTILAVDEQQAVKILLATPKRVDAAILWMPDIQDLAKNTT